MQDWLVCELYIILNLILDFYLMNVNWKLYFLSFYFLFTFNGSDSDIWDSFYSAVYLYIYAFEIYQQKFL